MTDTIRDHLSSSGRSNPDSPSPDPSGRPDDSLDVLLVQASSEGDASGGARRVEEHLHESRHSVGVRWAPDLVAWTTKIEEWSPNVVVLDGTAGCEQPAANETNRPGISKSVHRRACWLRRKRVPTGLGRGNNRMSFAGDSAHPHSLDGPSAEFTGRYRSSGRLKSGSVSYGRSPKTCWRESADQIPGSA